MTKPEREAANAKARDVGNSLNQANLSLTNGAVESAKKAYIDNKINPKSDDEKTIYDYRDEIVNQAKNRAENTDFESLANENFPTQNQILIDQANIDAQKKLINQQEIALAKSNQQRIQDAELLNLKAQQAREVASNQWAQGHRELWGDIVFSGGKDLSREFDKAYKLDSNFFNTLDTTIPTSLKHSLEQNDMAARHRNEQINLATSIARRQANEEFEALEDGLKAQMAAYMKGTSVMWPLAAKTEFDLMTREYAIESQSRGDRSATIGGVFPALYNGTNYLLDSIYNMNMTLGKSLINLEWSTVKDDPYSKWAEREFGFSFTRPEDFLNNTAYSPIDKFSLAYAGSTLVESLPEMGMLFFGMGSFRFGNIIGKSAFNKALGQVDNFVLSRAEKSIMKRANVLRAAGNTEAAIAMEQLAAKMSSRAFLGADLKKYQKALNLGVSEFGVGSSAIRRAELTRTEFARFMGKLAGKNKLTRDMARRMKTFGTGVTGSKLANFATSFPFAFFTFDLARRTIQLANERGEGSNVRWADLVGALVHLGVDWAGVLAGTHGLNQIAKNVSKKGIGKALGIAGLDAVSTMGIEGVGEGIQTYMEQQAKSDWTLPPLFELLNSPEFKESGDQIKLATLLGGAAGGMMSVITSSASGIMNSGINVAQTIKEKFDSKKGKKDKSSEPTYSKTLSGEYVAMRDPEELIAEEITAAKLEVSKKKAVKDIDKATGKASVADTTAEEEDIKKRETLETAIKEAKNRVFGDPDSSGKRTGKGSLSKHGISSEDIHGETKEKQATSYSDLRTKVQRQLDIAQREKRNAEAITDTAKRNAEVAAKEKEIQDLESLDKDLEFLQTQQTARHFHRAATKSANRAMNNAKSEFADPAKKAAVQQALDDISNASSKEGLAKAVNDLIGLTGDKSMWNYYQKLLKSKHIQPKRTGVKIGETSGAKDGTSHSNKPSSDDSVIDDEAALEEEDTEELGAKSTTSATVDPAEETGEDMDIATIRNELQKLDTATQLAILAMHDAQSAVDISNINAILTGDNIDPRVREFFRANTAVVIEKDLLTDTGSNTKSNVRQRMAAKANTGTIDVSPFEMVIVENQQIRFNPETNEWEIFNVDTKGASIDMMNNKIAEAITGLREEGRKEISNIMKEITSLLSSKSGADNVANINSQINSLQHFHRKKLKAIAKHISALNYLIMIMPDNSNVSVKLRQLLKNVERELKTEQKEIIDLLKTVKRQLGSSDSVTLEAFDEQLDSNEQLDNFVSGISSTIYASIRNTSSRLFSSIRQKIEQYESMQDGSKEKKNFQKSILNIIKQIGKVLFRINDFINGKEFQDLYATVYSLLEAKNVDYILASHIENDTVSILEFNKKDGTTETAKVKFNPMLKWLPISMQELLSGLLGRMRFNDIPEVLMNRILNKDNLLNKDGTLNREAVEAMAPFLHIMRDVKVSFRIKTETSASTSRANPVSTSKEQIVNITLADLIDCNDFNIFNSVLSSSDMNFNGEIITENNFSKPDLRQHLQEKMIEKFLSGKDSDIQLRIRNAIVNNTAFVTHMENMLDIGLVLQVYQLQNSSANEQGVFESKLQSKNISWARRMLIKEDESNISSTAFEEFANAAIALANNYLATKDYVHLDVDGKTQYRPLLVINPQNQTIQKEDKTFNRLHNPEQLDELPEGETLLKSEFIPGLWFSEDFIHEIQHNRDLTKLLETWVNLMTNRTLMSNTIDDIVIQLVRSSLPVSQKMVFINSLQQTAIKIDDSVLNALDKLLYPNYSKNSRQIVNDFLVALSDPKNIMDADAFNLMKKHYHSLDDVREKYKILEQNDGRNFYGNWKRVSINKSHNFKYTDEKGNIVESGENFTDDFVYVYLPKMAFKYDPNTHDIVPAIDGNQDILNRWLEEVVPNYKTTGSKAFLNSLVTATQTSVDAITNKETITNSVLDRMESVSASFGTVLSMATAYHLQQNPTEQNESNKMIVNGNIDYTKPIYFAHQQQPDGRVSAMSSKLAGNKLAKIFKVEQPEYFYNIKQLKEMKGYQHKSQFYKTDSSGNKHFIQPEKNKRYRNPEYYQWGLDEAYNENTRPKDLNDFKINNKYTAVRYGQFAAFLRIFGLDVEKYKLKDTNRPSHPLTTYRAVYSKTFSIDLSIFNAAQRDGIKKQLNDIKEKDLIEVKESGDIITVNLLDIGQLYQKMLDGNVSINKKIHTMLSMYSNSTEYNGLTLFSDHLADSMYNLNEFFVNYDEASGIFKLHEIDNRQLRVYFDGTSTLYYQNAIRFLATQLGITLTGINESSSVDGLHPEFLKRFSSHIFGVQRGLEKQQLADLISGWLNSTNNNIDQKAKDKVKAIVEDKGIDGHTLPLILMTISDSTVTTMSLSTYLFVNSLLGNRDTIKGVMTPLGYNAQIDNILSIAQDSIIQTVQPALTNAVISFADQNIDMNVAVSSATTYSAKNVKEFLNNLYKALQSAANETEKSHIYAKFGTVFMKKFLKYIETDEFITSFIGENISDKSKDYYKSIFSSFVNYFNADPTKQIVFFTTLHVNGSFMHFQNDLSVAYPSLQNVSKGIISFMDKENERLKKYNKYFGTTKSVDGEQNILVQLNSETLHIAEQLIDYLEENQGNRFVQRLTIMHSLIKQEWIDSVNKKSMTISFNIDGDKYELILNKNGKDFDIYDSEGNIVENDIFCDKIKKQYNNDPENKKYRRTTDTLGDIETLNKDILYIFSRLAAFKHATGSNLQTHLPLGYDANPLLQLPRQAADLLEKVAPHIYHSLCASIIIGVDSIYKQVADKFAREKGISSDYLNTNQEFIREFTYKKNKYIEDFLADYFERAAYSRSNESNFSGSYTPLFTQNPDEDINTKHYQTVKILSAVFSEQTTDVFLTRANLDIHSKINILRDFGKTKQITLPGTNALFNQPFEAYVVSHILGMTRQTFDSVETSAVNFFNALQTWNSENRLFDIKNDTAGIAERYLKSIDKTSKKMAIKYSITDNINMVDYVISKLRDPSVSDETKNVYKTFLADEIKSRLNMIKHYFSLSRTDNAGWSGNVLFADYSGILRGGNLLNGKTAVKGARNSALINLQNLLEKVYQVDSSIVTSIAESQEIDTFNRPSINLLQLLQSYSKEQGTEFASDGSTKSINLKNSETMNRLTEYLSIELQKDTIERAEHIDKQNKEFFERENTKVESPVKTLFNYASIFARKVAQWIFGDVIDNSHYPLFAVVDDNDTKTVIIEIDDNSIANNIKVVDFSDDSSINSVKNDTRYIPVLVRNVVEGFFRHNGNDNEAAINQAVNLILTDMRNSNKSYSINSFYKELKRLTVSVFIAQYLINNGNAINTANKEEFSLFTDEDMLGEKIFSAPNSIINYAIPGYNYSLQLNFSSFRSPENIVNDTNILLEILNLRKNIIATDLSNLGDIASFYKSKGYENIYFVHATNDLYEISPINSYKNQMDFGENPYYVMMATSNQGVVNVQRNSIDVELSKMLGIYNGSATLSNKPGRGNTIDLTNSQNQINRFKSDIDEDIDLMMSENEDLAEEFGLLKNFVDGVWKYLREGIEVFYYKYKLDDVGRFISNASGDKIIIGANKAVYTRLHEFVHAVTYHAMNTGSNRAHTLLARLEDLRNQVKDNIDLMSQEEREALGINDDIYSYLFAQEGKDSVNSLAEFIATFYSEPQLIRYLKNHSFKTRFPSLKQHEGKWNKALHAIPAVLNYITHTVSRTLTGSNGINAFTMLTQTLHELAQQNTEAGRLEFREYVNGKPINRLNSEIKNYAKSIFRRKFTEQEWADINGITDVNEEITRMFDEYLDTDETFQSLLEVGQKIRGIETKPVKLAMLGLWLISTFAVKIAHILDENPLQRAAINEAIADLRARVLQGTFFDSLIKLDFGIAPNRFLGQQANLINRASSLRNNLDYESNQAENMIKQQVAQWINGNQKLKEMLDEDPQSRIQYETALFKTITHLNLGDFFFFDNEISMSDVNKLSNYVLNIDSEQTLAECRSDAFDYVQQAFQELNIDDVEYQNAIRTLVIDLAKARISDQLNEVNTSNIEMGMKQLGFTEYNAKAMGYLHKAITLEAIAFPFREQNSNDGSSIYYKEETKLLRQLHTVIEAQGSEENIEIGNHIKTTLDRLIRLHAMKHKQMYQVRSLKQGQLNRFLRSTNLDEQPRLDDLYTSNTRDLYDITDLFEHNSYDAYYLDSRKPYKFNHQRDVKEISPENPPLPDNIARQVNAGLKILTQEEKRHYYNIAKKKYSALGYKPLNLNNIEGQDPKYVTDDGTEIWIRESWIDLKTHKTERLYKSDPGGHKGRISYLLNDTEMSIEKEEYDIDYAEIMKQKLLEKGRKYSDDYVGATQKDYENTSKRLRTKAGSSTMLETSRLSTQEYETIVNPSKSIVDAFGEMERTIHNNMERHVLNDQIFYQILQSDNTVRNRRTSLDDDTMPHNSEILFYIDNGKLTFNHSLTDKYNIYLSARDEDDFANLYNHLPDNEKTYLDNAVYIDSRLINVYFGRPNLDIGRKYEDSHPLVFKAMKTFQTVWQSLLSSAKNTIIMRNPELVYINGSGNFWGLVGEGIPFSQAVESWSYYADKLKEYNDDYSAKLELQNTISVFERVAYTQDETVIIPRPEGKDDIRFNTHEEYRKVIDVLKDELEILDKKINRNPVMPLVKAGMYSNLIEDVDRENTDLIEHAVEWAITNAKFDKKKSYIAREAFLQESSDTYKIAGHLTRMGDFIPRVVLYYHLRDEGMSHKQALDEARDRFINYNTPIWSNTLADLEQAGMVMFTKYRFAVQYQIMKAFAHAPVQATGLMAANIMLEAAGLKRHPFVSYMEEFGNSIPNGVWNMGLDVVTNVNRWKFIEQFSDDVDNVLGLAS